MQVQVVEGPEMGVCGLERFLLLMMTLYILMIIILIWRSHDF